MIYKSKTPKPSLGLKINPDHPLSQGLVGAWLFNEQGAPPADLVTGIRTVYTGTPLWRVGSFGSGVQLDGSSSYLTADTHPLYNISEDFTIIAWIRRTALLELGSILEKYTGSDWDFLFYFAASGHNRFSIYSGGVGIVDSTVGVGDTEPHVLAVTRKGSAVNFYIDGLDAGTATLSGSFGTSGTSIRMGAYQTPSIEYYGTLLYRRGLSQSEIQSLCIDPYQIIADTGNVFTNRRLHTSISFPAATTLDSFNRSNESPASGWSPALDSTSGVKVVGNEVVSQNTPTAYAYAYWDAEMFDADQEAHLTLTSTLTGVNMVGLLLRWTNPDSGNENGFLVQQDSAAITVWDITNGSFTTLGSTISNVPSIGDKLGARVIGDDLIVYFKSGAGNWLPLATRDASSHNNAGYVGINFNDASSAADDYGGGPVEQPAVSSFESVALFRGRNFPFFDDDEVNRYEFWPPISGDAVGPTMVFGLTGR